MDVAGSSAAAADDTARKSSRLKGKPRLDVAKLMSDHIPMPQLTPEDRRRMAKGKSPAAKAALSANTRPTATIVVGSEGRKREITVYPCRVCDFLGRAPNSAINHEHKEHPKKKRCKICSKYMRCPADLETHCLEIHQSTTWAVKCDSCEFIAADQSTLEAHTEYEHYSGAKRNEYCREMLDGRQCTARFVRVKELRKHLATAHGLDAATDTIEEQFQTWEEFMRWKAQFELETRSVYKIGYGRRHGVRRYMCVRSGRYKPVPDEKRQRRPRENRTIKLGFNCTSTMACKFPDAGGVYVVVHPFHYGHKAGDRRLCGLKPEGAPDDWVRLDTRKRKKKLPKPVKVEHIEVEHIEVVTLTMESLADGNASFPELTEDHDGECELDNGDQVSSQESAAAIAAITADTATANDTAADTTETAVDTAAITAITATAAPDAAPPEGSDVRAEGRAMAIEPGGGDNGDGAKSSDAPGTGAGSGDGGGDGDVSMQSAAAGGDADGKPKKTAPTPDSARMQTLRRRPGPKSKCGPRSPSPPPPPPEFRLRLVPEPEPRRGLFGRPLAARGFGPGSRYRKMLRRARTMNGLRSQLSAQLARLVETRELHPKSVSSGPAVGPAGGVCGSGGLMRSRLIGTPLEDVTEIEETPLPLAVLRVATRDLDTLPDGVFAAMDLVTAPTDLQEATDTIFDLKAEILSLRARLVRRAAVETALRADALEAAAQRQAAERELRAKLEQARAAQGTEAQRLRQLLESVFSSAQVMALEETEAAVPWAAEDYEQSLSLRWLCNQQAFDFVRHDLRVPLPSMAAVRAVASNGRMRHVADTYMELIRAKALEGDTVGEVEDRGDGMEVRMVVEVPADDAASDTLITPTAHDHSCFSAPDQPTYRRRRTKEARRAAAEAAVEPAVNLTPGAVRTIRLRHLNGEEESVAVTLQVADAGGQVWQRSAAADEHADEDEEPTVVIGHLEEVEEVAEEALEAVEFIGPHTGGASADAPQSATETSSPGNPPSKRARY